MSFDVVGRLLAFIAGIAALVTAVGLLTGSTVLFEPYVGIPLGIILLGIVLLNLSIEFSSPINIGLLGWTTVVIFSLGSFTLMSGNEALFGDGLLRLGLIVLLFIDVPFLLLSSIVQSNASYGEQSKFDYSSANSAEDYYENWSNARAASPEAYDYSPYACADSLEAIEAWAIRSSDPSKKATCLECGKRFGTNHDRDQHFSAKHGA